MWVDCIQSAEGPTSKSRFPGEEIWFCFSGENRLIQRSLPLLSKARETRPSLESCLEVGCGLCWSQVRNCHSQTPGWKTHEAQAFPLLPPQPHHHSLWPSPPTGQPRSGGGPTLRQQPGSGSLAISGQSSPALFTPAPRLEALLQSLSGVSEVLELK